MVEIEILQDRDRAREDPHETRERPMQETQTGSGERPNLKTLLDAYERQLIESALATTAGNQRRAAARLGLLPTTLHEKMKRLGLLPRRARLDGAPAVAAPH